MATRAAILQAAAIDLAVNGGLGLGRVAVRAGVSRQAIHYHFGSRRGLADAVRESGLGEPPTEQDQATRERILDAGVAVLARGVGTTALDAIASEAGVTKGAIYHHFPDRAALLRAIAQHVSFEADLFAVLDATDGRPARDVLADLAHVYEAAIRERAPIIRGLLGAERDDPGIVAVVAGEVIGRAAGRVLAWLARRIEAGEVRPASPAVVAMLIFGPILVRALMGGAVDRVRVVAGAFQPAMPADLTQASIEVLCQGILPSDASAPPTALIRPTGRRRTASATASRPAGPVGRSGSVRDPTGPPDPAQGT